MKQKSSVKWTRLDELEIKATAYLCIGNCVYLLFGFVECLYMVLQHLAIMAFIVALMPLLVTLSSLVM